LRIFNLLNIFEDKDYNSISSIVKLIKGYHSITEDKRELKSFDFSTNEILKEEYENTLSEKISQLNIETLGVLEENVKLLEVLTRTEFELLLTTLEPYSGEFRLSVTNLRKAFSKRNPIQWNKAIESSIIKDWDIMVSYGGLTLESTSHNEQKQFFEEWKAKGILELNLYYRCRKPITHENLTSKNIEHNHQIYLRARVFAKLERLFKTRTEIVLDTIDILKVYINREVKPIIHVLLSISMGVTDEKLQSDIQKYEEELSYLLSSNQKTIQLNRNLKYINCDDDLKQIKNQIIVITKSLSAKSRLLSKCKNQIFNLIKLIRFKYFGALHQLKIDEIREQIENMKDNLSPIVDEYAILFKNQLDNLYKKLLPSLNSDKLVTNYNTIRAYILNTLQEDTKSGVTQDIEYSKFVEEGLFMNNYKLIVDHIRTLSKDEANKYFTEIISEISELNNYLKNINNPNKSTLDEKSEKNIRSVLPKYFGKFSLSHLDHYLKFGSRLLIALRELETLYNTELEFTDKKILLRKISYFEIIDAKGSVGGKSYIVSMKLFGYKSSDNLSLEFALGPIAYEELKRPMASLEFTIIKYMLYFGKKIEAADEKKLVFCDLGKCDKENSVHIHEKNSLIFSTFESRYLKLD
jgi:hypothetical protein